MSDKITPSHLRRRACVYLRQSSPAQVEHNRESTARQYKLVERAARLGWRPEQVCVIDEDLGVTGSGVADRDGFERMASDVAMGRVGLILAIEVSRMARNNTEWHRLLDFCGVTDTLIGDEDGIYHPRIYDDRLLLGLKGTMSEAELHLIRARMVGGVRNKARRGALRVWLPIGFIWGEGEGEILLDPDEAVRRAVLTVFEKFAESGAVHQVWEWFRSQGLLFPSRPRLGGPIRWVVPGYHAVRSILTNPVYAGAYVFGKSRTDQYIDEAGRVRKKTRRAPPAEWQVLIKQHHPGFVDWETYEMNQARIAKNARPHPRESGGALREGSALLQGLAACGRCGRKMKVSYQGAGAAAAYMCQTGAAMNGAQKYCTRISGVAIDRAVAEAFLEAVEPAGVEAALEAERLLESDRDAAIAQLRLRVERATYEAEKAERRYRLAEPENRLVARNLESDWEARLRELAAAKVDFEDGEWRRRRELSAAEREHLRALGRDLRAAWHAPTTTNRDRKELLRCLIEEAAITVDRGAATAHLMLRWRGGAITEFDVSTRRPRAAAARTEEESIELTRRLAPLYSNATIAGILNRQGRRTAHGKRFTAVSVSGIRQYWNLPRWERRVTESDAEVMTVRDAAKALGVAPSTLFRHLNDGIIAGEQLTPGAPWRIRMTQEIRARYTQEAPEGYVRIADAIRILGVSRQTVLQRVKRGQLQALYVNRGKHKGLRIKVIDDQLTLFAGTS